MLTDLDAALERFHQSDFECGDGSANLGPVAVTALEALGHPALIPFFVDVYVPRLRPLVPGAPIPSADRTRLLGDRTRRADWLATFETAVADGGQAAVLEHWLPVLLSGAVAGSGAGVQRTAAALVSLGAHDTALGRRELAFGLAGWASRYQSLPGEPGVFPLAPIDLEAAPAGDAILGRVAVLAERQLARPDARTEYSEAISVAMALHTLLAFVPVSLHAELVGRVAQIALAVQRVCGDGAPTAERAEDRDRDALANDEGEIRYRAACSREPNAIIEAEACLRAHALRPEPVLLAVAADAALRFGARFGG